MIIDELIIEDFGVYAGEQRIKLSPPSPKKPIVLIGGLNGGGKTTFLDAIQLCLYGQFAPCSNRGRLGYHDFLRGCINQLDDERSAKVELIFRHTSDGTEDLYRVKRKWSDNGERISEEFCVYLNGHEDHLLSENWTESVERILPRRIANLFLFDGEKIEGYASPETAAELIKTATHSLLGLDVVDQLDRDLDSLKQRQVKNKGDGKLRREVEDAQTEFERLTVERRRINEERVTLQTHDVDQIEKRLEEANREFERNGGHLFEKQTELEQDYKAIEIEIAEVKNELRELASGSLPLLLVKDLVGGIVEQAHREDEASNNLAFINQASSRDHEVLKFLKESTAEKSLIDALGGFLESDLLERAKAVQHETYLSLSLAGLAHTDHVHKNGLKEVYEQCQSALRRLETLQIKSDRKQTELSSIPAEEVVREIMIKRTALQDQLAEVNSKLLTLNDDYNRIETSTLRAKQRLARQLDKRVRADFKDEDDLRIINHAHRVQETLVKFRQRAVERHIGRIQKLVNESFKSLHRKKNTVNEIVIDKDSFAITIYGAKGEVLPSDRLSAGERQLLAVAVLWGLARASHRQLPTVIDTPLGRLDSNHRTNLVERYFPHASHQVILLSTDEEITNQYLTKLMPSIGRRYELVFDDHAHTTTIREGYFAEGNNHVH